MGLQIQNRSLSEETEGEKGSDQIAFTTFVGVALEWKCHETDMEAFPSSESNRSYNREVNWDVWEEGPYASLRSLELISDLGWLPDGLRWLPNFLQCEMQAVKKEEGNLKRVLETNYNGVPQELLIVPNAFQVVPSSSSEVLRAVWAI